MNDDDNINDFSYKINPKKLTSQITQKNNVTQMMKQLMIDDNNINDLVIKSI